MINFTGTGPYCEMTDGDDELEQDFDPRDRDTFSWEDEDAQRDLEREND